MSSTNQQTESVLPRGGDEVLRNGSSVRVVLQGLPVYWSSLGRLRHAPLPNTFPARVLPSSKNVLV